MKKTKCLFILSVCAILLFTGLSFGQADLSGTWIGTAEVPDAPELDKITMMLKKSNGSYSGTVTDSFGLADESEIKELEFSDNTLTFNFLINEEGEYSTIYCTLTVDGDSMKGYWENEEGDTGELILAKQK
ncbi:MAG: hypothetical protein JXB26_14545 [Candidatus Aminicenantes bacterium]|nr:hypothetical protein [Candidatus Aminicenantes bacterium]